MDDRESNSVKPLPPVPQIPENVRPHKTGDWTGVLFRALKDLGDGVVNQAGETVPPIAQFGVGFATASALAAATAPYHDDEVLIRMSIVQTMELGERIKKAAIPVIQQIIEAEIHRFEAELKHAELAIQTNGNPNIVIDLEDATNGL